MPKRPSAGALIQKVAFDKRETGNPDSPVDYGNTLEEWVEQFSCRAAFIHLRGGESVIAARLQSQHIQVIRVRASDASRAVTPDWRVRDERTGVFDTNGKWTGNSFNVRDVTPSDDRQFIDFLCESGVAT